MPTLTFIYADDEYSTYRRPDGSRAFLAHGTPRTYLYEFSDDVLRELWDDFPSVNIERFIDYLRDVLTEPHIADEIFGCDACGLPNHTDHAYAVENGEDTVCDECIGQYRACDECEVTTRYTYTCDRCGQVMCSSCDDYHADAHQYDYEECDCEHPDQSFIFAGIQNDVTSSVALPAGHIDPTGIGQISGLLANEGLWDAVYALNRVEHVWQTREGTFPKRLGKVLYKEYNKATLPDAVRAKVGNIAREFSGATNVTVAFTRDLNQSASAFYNGGSCWWSEESRSRCVFKENGGIGMRTFDENGRVTGRAWVLPIIRQENGHAPTGDAQDADAFLVFNGYGELEGSKSARILAALTGHQVQRVSFYCDSAMYVNGSTAYLITPEQETDRTHIQLSLDVMH